MIKMLFFKLYASLLFLQPLFFKNANYINNLWEDFDEDVPKFVDKFVEYWSEANYIAFHQQVQKWSVANNADPKEETWFRIRALIIRDKQAFLLRTVKGFMDKIQDDSSSLQHYEDDIQKLCDEIAEQEHVIVVNSMAFSKFQSSYDRLKELSNAMHLHISNWLNRQSDFERSYKLDANEQTNLILGERRMME